MTDPSASAMVDGRTLRHQHRRPELLAEVTEYVLDHGIVDLSLRRMGQALGVTHATLIRHFRSKDHLVNEVIVHIRADFLAGLQHDSGLLDTATATEFLGTAWERLKQPREQRQFLLLFEVAARATRQPGGTGDVSHAIVQGWLEPLEQRLLADGRSAEEAAATATLALALVRGLQLDLLVSGDRGRADAAFEVAMSQIARTPSKTEKASRPT